MAVSIDLSASASLRSPIRSQRSPALGMNWPAAIPRRHPTPRWRGVLVARTMTAMRSLAVMVLAVLSLSVTGCLDQPGGSTDWMSPVERCDRLVDLMCARSAECLSPDDGFSHTTCVQQINDLTPCASTRSVRPTYDTCYEQVATSECSQLFRVEDRTLVLPLDCRAVFGS